MKKIFISALVLCLSATTLTLHARERLSISLDVAQFYGSDDQAYLEIYYSLPEKEIVYRRNLQNMFESSILLNMQIYQSDTLWATKTWRVSDTVKDTTEAKLKEQMVDLIRYPVSANLPYRIKLYARDLQSGLLDSTSRECTGIDFSTGGLVISSLQLANSIQPFDSSCSKAFQKRVYCITPNPEITFGGAEGTLYYYFEVYNIKDNIKNGPFCVTSTIVDGSGEVCQQVPQNKVYKKVRQDMSREMGQFAVDVLPSGLYELVCTVCDSSEQIRAERRKNFLVRNPAAKFIAQNISTTAMFNFQFLEGMTKGMLDLEFEKMYPLVTKKERDLYKKLKELEGKKNFLYQMWAGLRGPEFASVEEFRNEYMNRVRLVGVQYKSSFREGWKTDRGRVYLKYGRPSDIERHPSSYDTLPYEIWSYEGLEGGVIFVFVDRMGVNTYDLIHSTKRGEMYDPNWQRQLQPIADSNFRM